MLAYFCGENVVQGSAKIVLCGRESGWILGVLLCDMVRGRLDVLATSSVRGEWRHVNCDIALQICPPKEKRRKVSYLSSFF